MSLASRRLAHWTEVGALDLAEATNRRNFQKLQDRLKLAGPPLQERFCQNSTRCRQFAALY